MSKVNHDEAKLDELYQLWSSDESALTMTGAMRTYHEHMAQQASKPKRPELPDDLRDLVGSEVEGFFDNKWHKVTIEGYTLKSDGSEGLEADDCMLWLNHGVVRMPLPDVESRVHDVVARSSLNTEDGGQESRRTIRRALREMFERECSE